MFVQISLLSKGRREVEREERKKEIEESENDMERGREEEKNQPAILPASCMDTTWEKKKPRR